MSFSPLLWLSLKTTPFPRDAPIFIRKQRARPRAAKRAGSDAMIAEQRGLS